MLRYARPAEALLRDLGVACLKQRNEDLRFPCSSPEQNPADVEPDEQRLPAPNDRMKRPDWVS